MIYRCCNHDNSYYAFVIKVTLGITIFVNRWKNDKHDIDFWFWVVYWFDIYNIIIWITIIARGMLAFKNVFGYDAMFVESKIKCKLVPVGEFLIFLYNVHKINSFTNLYTQETLSKQSHKIRSFLFQKPNTSFGCHQCMFLLGAASQNISHCIFFLLE